VPDSKRVRIIFSPSGKQGQFPVGTTVLQAARELGVDIDSICGGQACCGRCQVKPMAGKFVREGFVSSEDHLGPLSADERQCLASGQLEPGNRLSCHASLLADIKIDVPASSQVHRQLVRKDYEEHPIELDPLIHLYFVRVPVPDPDSGPPDTGLELLRATLAIDRGLSGMQADPKVLESLHSALRNDDRQVTVAVRDASRIVAVWPGFRDQAYGAAVDVGSTTIAVQLCDLSSGETLASTGAMNPQIRFGEDLMSRVSYAMQNPAGAGQMTRAVRSAINELLEKAIRLAGIDASQVLEVTLVGNPVMHHLLLGFDPAPLGAAPFALTVDQSVEVPAAELDLQLAACARAYALPCIAGHVGADTAAVLLAESPWQKDAVSLIIDIGTNAEIILGNREKLLAASSPTGPAFEGAQISHGQRAAPGAIERVRIDPRTLEPRFKVIGGQCWSDEPGFADGPGDQAVTGICGSGIIEAIAGMYLAGIVQADGVINGELGDRNARIAADGRTFSYLLYAGEPEIRIRQADVRAIQLAKAALYAGTRLLMDRFGVSQVDRIRLAGAFGSHIDVRYAMVLGLLPDCDLEHVSSAGNAAGTGARIALLSKGARREIEARVRQVEKIEIAIDESFQQHFVAAMSIPHATEAYPLLSASIDLPESPAEKTTRGRTRRSKTSTRT
jgi:uncharacterized 2Fe-2S/4Fe-4S cluster protein (DUF4445 family)